MHKNIFKLRDRLGAAFNKIKNEQLKTNLLQALPFWVASLLTGLVAVFYARLFAWAESWAAHIYKNSGWIFFIVTPFCFILSWWVVKKFAPFARGSGIPQVMAAIEIVSPGNVKKVNRLLSIRIIIIKIISSIILVFGGGAIGREGPTIQIAGSIFRKVNQVLPAWWPKISKRNMIMTGSAAGLAAAFNTPLGGIVFAVEELTKTHISYFKTALFSAVIIAGLTAQGLLGPYLYLGFPDVSNLSGYIFLMVIVVAAIAGIAGSFMSKIILWLFNWKARFKFKYQAFLFVMVCGVIISFIGFFISNSIYGSGKELMTHTLFSSDKQVEWYVPLLRMAGPVLSFTTGASGGVFAPSLGAGASIGSVLSGWLELNATNTNLLVLAGMVGFLTGVTRTPFTSAILVLEMTDRHNVIFHLMLAGMVATLVSIFVDKRSFYDHLKEKYINEAEKEEEIEQKKILEKENDEEKKSDNNDKQES